MGYIEKLRSKSDETKARYAFLAALLVTLVITGVWFSTLPARFAEMDASKKSPDTDEPSSLSDLFGNTKDQLGAVLEGANDVRETGDGYAPETEGGAGDTNTEPTVIPGALGRLDEPRATSSEDAPAQEEAPMPESGSATDVQPPLPLPHTVTPTTTVTKTPLPGAPALIEIAPSPTPRTILIGTTTPTGTP